MQAQSLQQESSTRMSTVANQLSAIGSRLDSIESNLPGYINENAPNLVITPNDMMPVTAHNLNTLKVYGNM